MQNAFFEQKEAKAAKERREVALHFSAFFAIFGSKSSGDQP
jgi:hypothetical protein